MWGLDEYSSRRPDSEMIIDCHKNSVFVRGKNGWSERAHTGGNAERFRGEKVSMCIREERERWRESGGAGGGTEERLN